MARDYQSRGYIGGAPVTSTISGSIGTGDTTFAFNTGGGTGFPTTNFWAVLDAGNASAEKVLIGSRSGDNCTSVQRGADGTTAKAHTNCSIIHTGAAQDFIEANAIASALTTKGDSLWKGGTLSVAPARLAAGTDQQIVRYLAANALGVETTHKGTLPIFTTTGARDAAIAAPSSGQGNYQDTGDSAEGLWFYNGTNWRPPWNMNWGVVASASSTSDQTGIGTVVDITFATATFTAVSNRLYRITLSVLPNHVSTAGTDTLEIQTGASGAGSLIYRAFLVNQAFPSTHVGFHTGAGSISVHARASTTSGSISILNATAKGWFVVEDVGPTGAPA